MLNSFFVMHALKPGNFTKNVQFINDFATKLFQGFMNIDIFFKIACTEPKVQSGIFLDQLS